MTITGFALGGSLYSYQIEAGDSNDEYRSDISTLSTEDIQSIENIDFDIETSEVNIISGESYSVSGTGRYNSYVKNGVWHVKTKHRTASITFLTRKIEIPVFWNYAGVKQSANTITIPENTNFENANIKIAAGTLSGNRISADDIKLKIGAGSIKFQEIMAKDLNVKVGGGEAIFNQVNVTESCNVKVGAGQINLGNEDTPYNNNAINDLLVKCAAGNITVAGKLTGDCNLKCSTGEIDAYLDGTRSNYSIDSQSSLSNIHIDSDDTFSNEKNSEHFGDLRIKCSLGDVSVGFRK